MSGLAAYRTFWSTSLASNATEKLAEFGVYFLAPGDQLFNSRDLAVYFHVHHLLPDISYVTHQRADRLLDSALRVTAHVSLCDATGMNELV